MQVFKAIAVLSFVFANSSIVLGNPAKTKNSKLINVGCQRANDGCWVALARVVKDNPSTQYFSVNVSENTGSYLILDSEIATSREYRWFYNKNISVVDYRGYGLEPPGLWRVEFQRRRYDNITPQLLKAFLLYEGNVKVRNFDSFATQYGSRWIETVNLLPRK